MPRVVDWLRAVLAAFIFFAIMLTGGAPRAESAPQVASAMRTAQNTLPRLLQFRAGGHIIGFEPTRVYLVALDHALSVEFLGTAGVIPESLSPPSQEGEAKIAGPLTQVTYKDLWPGINVTYEMVDGGIAKSTYWLAPYADLSQIRLQYNVPVAAQQDGSLQFAFGRGELTESAPVAWQEIGGERVPVPVAFSVTQDQATRSDTVGFSVGQYDPRFALTIDPTYAWHTFYRSSFNTVETSIAVDTDGNVYIAGSSDALWLGDGNQSPKHEYSGGSDIVVVKLNTSGDYQWHTFAGSAGSSSLDIAYGVALDASANVYVTGSSDATWLVDGSKNPKHGFTGAGDLFVLSLKNDGSYLWHTFYGANTGGHVYGHGIAVDQDGNVYIAGSSDADWPIIILPGILHSYTGGTDLVVLKLNSIGEYQWHTFYGSSSSDSGSAIAVDGSGNAYVTGSSYTTWIGYGGKTPKHAHSGSDDLVVLELDASGAYQWHTFYGSTTYDSGKGVALDASGNVYVTGNSGATWQGDGPTNPKHGHSGDGDVVVIKLSTKGDYAWHTFYGSSVYDVGNSIAADTGGNIYLTGFSDATWQGDNSANPRHPFSGFRDIVVEKLNSDGAYQWHTFYGSGGLSDLNAGTSIAVDVGGSIYVAGYSSDSWQGDGPTNPKHAHDGATDLVVLKLLGKDTTHAALGSSLNPSIFGQHITLTATVTSSGKPTGQVTLKEGATALGTGTLSSGGTVTFDTAALPAGTHSLTAEYGGDENSFPSQSSALQQTINKANTTTTLSAHTPDPSVVGQAVSTSFSVTVNPPGSGTPTGTVSVGDGTVNCTSALPDNHCSLVLPSIGTKTLTATYPGDANFAGSSAAVSHTVKNAVVYLPLLMRNYVAAPDLIVESIRATASSVQVVIRNAGEAPAPVSDQLWVDAYFDPNPVPTHVNQTCETSGGYGIVWNLRAALPLAPGATLTLTTGDQYISHVYDTYCHTTLPVPAGTRIYVQVDSANVKTSYGYVLESHEMNGGAYNNIASATVGTSLPAVPNRPPPAVQGGAPPR